MQENRDSSSIPSVSIIMPVYQVEKYIAKSVESVCRQDYENIEIILVNDGTTDRSMEIAAEVLKRYSFTNYKVVEQCNCGVSVARNAGIKAANGEWVICIDPDDIIRSNFIAEMIRCFKKEKEIDLIITNYVIRNEGSKLMPEPNDKSAYTVYGSKEAQKLFLLRKLPIIAPGIMARRSFLIDNQFFYPENIRFSEDLIYVWNLLFGTQKILYIWNQRYIYIRRENSTMTSSKQDKVLNGYSGIQEFASKLEDGQFSKWLIARWVLGVMRATAKMMDKSDYLELLSKMNYRHWMNELHNFEERKAKALSRIFLFSSTLGYRICKKN